MPPADPPAVHAACQAAYDFNVERGRLPTVRELAQRMALSYARAYVLAKQGALNLPEAPRGRPRVRGGA